jgi:hypothetical protein
VASLIGAPESSSAASPQSADLARAAAQLLAGGKAESAVKEAVEPAKPKAPAAQAKPPSSPAPAAKVASADEAPGVLGKLKNLFGGKR